MEITESSLQLSLLRYAVNVSFFNPLLRSFKRKGSHVAKTLMWKQLYEDHTPLNTSSMLTQLSFLTSLTERLKTSPEEVLTAMSAVREGLTQPTNLRVFMACDVSALPQPRPLDLWRSFPPQTRC